MQGCKMKKHFYIYKEFFKTSLIYDLSFRANFILHSMMNICFMSIYFFSSFFIFNHVEHIGLWSKDEFLFFLAFALLLDQIHFLVLSFNFWIFSDEVRTGGFDFYLLKPSSSLFITFFNRLAIPGLFTIPVALGLFIYYGLNLNLSFWLWLSMPICLLASLLLLFGLELVISSFNFFTIQGDGLNQARLQIQQLSRWPDFIYKNPARLFLIPFLAISSIPVRWILDFSYWTWFILMGVGVLLLWLAIIFFIWPWALRAYQSASS